MIIVVVGSGSSTCRPSGVIMIVVGDDCRHASNSVSDALWPPGGGSGNPDCPEPGLQRAGRLTRAVPSRASKISRLGRDGAWHAACFVW